MECWNNVEDEDENEHEDDYMLINNILLNLLEAQVTLYATQADGVTLGSPIWSGQAAEKLMVRERWITKETRPTGAPYPRKHPLVPQYEVSIDRVWALPLSNLVGFKPDSETYVLQIVWTEEETQQWHRRTFYRVTIEDRSFNSQSIESEFVDGQEFAAQYFLADSGLAGTTPPSTVSVPAVVFWSGTDGYFPLYTYTTANGFVLAQGATTAAHATIAADGSSIQFSGASSPALVTSANGVTVGELHDTMPSDLPQLRFYVGTQLLAVIDAAGFWCRTIGDGPISEIGGFQFLYQGVPVMVVVGANKIATALSWMAQN